jgi:nucleotide-binding universal stress UspA family protein
MAFATHILVPTDFSEASKLALNAASMLAKQIGAKVTVVHVHDPEALRPPATLGWSPAQQDEVEHEVEEAVAKSLEALRDDELAGLEDLDTVVLRDTSPAHAIVKYAEKIGADLVIIATHGRTGLKHLLIGSVAERVVRHAAMPVLTLRTTAAD